MPGTIWQILCTDCGARWETQAGVSMLDPDPSSLLPATCTTCQAIRTAEEHDGGWRCMRCEAPVDLLPGAVLDPGRELPETFPGTACPSCSAETLRASVGGRWD